MFPLKLRTVSSTGSTARQGPGLSWDPESTAGKSPSLQIPSIHPEAQLSDSEGHSREVQGNLMPLCDQAGSKIGVTCPEKNGRCVNRPSGHLKPLSWASFQLFPPVRSSEAPDTRER